MRSFRDIAEGIEIAADNRIDTIIRIYFNGKAITYKYNEEASFELGKIFNKVIITKDKKYMHIPETNKKSDEVKNKYKLKEV